MRNNYIIKLEAENKELKEKLAKTEESLSCYLGFLHSDKFKGTDSQGNRKDWIATADVVNTVREIRAELP